MARARNIKPGFFQNDDLGELPPLARLLFIGLWTIADFKGCLEMKPKRIKVQLLPYDDCDILDLAINLDKSGFISIYSVEGQQYIKINNFDRHQNPHKNEREAGSNIPDIDKKDSGINELKQNGINPDKNGTTRADSLILIPDSLNLLPDSLSADSKTIAPQSAAPKKKPEPKEEPNPLNLETWISYKQAYTSRYSVPPVRDAATNSKIKAIVKALGPEAPAVADFFVWHNGGKYVSGMHQIGMLSMDYAKLRTEWLTGNKMTNAKALQADKTQTNFDAFAPLIAAAEREEREGQNGE